MSSLPKQTPAQKIKRLERELSDERLKNEMLNMTIDRADQPYGTSIRKRYYPNNLEHPARKAGELITLLSTVWDK